MPHKLSLVIPGLCGPLPGLDDIETEAEPLLRLLNSTTRLESAAPDWTGLLTTLFGTQTQQAFPYAALAMLAHDRQPGGHCWIHADPVFLQADMDRAILSDAQSLDIREHEAGQLVQELNAHFAEEDISLVPLDDCNWMIRLNTCDLETTPLARAVGRNINYLLPTGEVAAGWKRRLNEAQMLLHMSTVNQQREDRGMAPVNSLWLWGQGVLPAVGETDITHVYADDAVTTGLAKLNNIRHSALNDPVELAYAMKAEGHSLVSMPRLEAHCNQGDTGAWLGEMLDIVEYWLKPLLATATSLDADVNIYPCNGVRYHFDNKNKFNISQLMFWKKGRLQDHVDSQ
jgi:hypothetical protein